MATITPNSDLGDGSAKLSVADFHAGMQVMFAVHHSVGITYELLHLAPVPAPKPPSPADSAAIAAKQAAAVTDARSQSEFQSRGVVCMPTFTVGETVYFAATRTGADTYELLLVDVP